MGQTCFHTDNVSEKTKPNLPPSTSPKKEKLSSMTNKLGFTEIPDAMTASSSNNINKKEIEKEYIPDRKCDSIYDLKNLNPPKLLSPYLNHTNFKKFESVFKDETAPLSLKSCDNANMPNYVIVGSEDGNIVLIDYETGEINHRWSEAHERDVNYLTKPLSNGYFASASRDKLVKVWNLKNEKYLCELKGHSLNVTCVTFILNDVNFIVSGSRDNTVRLWDVEQTKELECCDIKQNIVHFVQWVPQIQCVAQGGEDLTLRLWDIRMNLNKNKIQGLNLNSTLTSIDYHPICCSLSSNNSNYNLLTGHNGFNGHGSYIMEWDLRMLKSVKTFYGHRGTVRSISHCVFPKSLSEEYFVSAGDDSAIAFFSTQSINNETDINIKSDNIYKIPESRVTCLDTSKNSDIFASTRTGAIIVFRPTYEETGIIEPMKRFRYFEPV